MDDNSFRQLLAELKLSWPGYRKVRKGVKKRINRHMQELCCSTVDAYLTELNRNQTAREQAKLLMTVSISRFFRDRKLWDCLLEKIVPDMTSKGEKSLRVWSAGCAGGEEAYSFMIIWDRLRALRGKLPELSMIATDMNPSCIERARAGVYLLSSLREVEEKFRRGYFEKERGKKRYVIKSRLKRDIRWEERDLAEGPPEPTFHMIFLRNSLLTYYLEPMKSRVFREVLDSLLPMGVLIIGAHEKLPGGTEELSASFCHSRIFIRK